MIEKRAKKSKNSIIDFIYLPFFYGIRNNRDDSFRQNRASALFGEKDDNIHHIYRGIFRITFFTWSPTIACRYTDKYISCTGSITYEKIFSSTLDFFTKCSCPSKRAYLWPIYYIFSIYASCYLAWKLFIDLGDKIFLSDKNMEQIPFFGNSRYDEISLDIYDCLNIDFSQYITQYFLYDHGTDTIRDRSSRRNTSYRNHVWNKKIENIIHTVQKRENVNSRNKSWIFLQRNNNISRPTTRIFREENAWLYFLFNYDNFNFI